MSALPGVLDLAAAGGTNLGIASDIVTDAMTGLGMSADQTGKFADMMAATITKSNTTIEMMGETLKYVSPVAGALGINMADLSVAIGLMGNAGVKSSQAGTALRAGLTRLVDPPRAAANVMEDLGISLQKNADGSVNMAKMMTHLRDRLGGMDNATQAAALSTIFGQEAMSGWAAIVNASTKDFDKLTNAISNSDGKAAEIAKTMNDNLSGAFKELSSAFEEAQISIGKQLIPAVRAGVVVVNKLVNIFNSFSPMTKKVLAFGAAFAALGAFAVAGFGILLVVVGSVVSAVASIGAAVAAAGGVMAALGAVAAPIMAIVGPVLAVVAAVVAAGIAFKTFYDRSQTLRDGLEAVKALMTGDFVKARGLLLGLGMTQTQIDNVRDAILRMKAGFEQAKQGVTTAITTIKGLIEGVLLVFEGNKGGAVSVLNGIGLSPETIMTIITTVENIKKTVSEFVASVGATIVKFWQENGTQIIQAASNLWNFLKVVFDNIKIVLTALWPVVKYLVMETWTAIKNMIQGAIKVIMGVIKVFTGLFTGDFSKMWEGIKDIFFGAIQAVWGYVNLLFVGKILKAGKALFTLLRGVVQSGWAAIRNFFVNGITKSQSAVSTGWSKIKGFFSEGIQSAKTKVSDGLVKIKTTFTTKLEDVTKNVKDWAGNLPSKLYDAFSAAVGKLRDIGSLVWDKIKGTLPTIGDIKDYVMGFFGGGSSSGNSVAGGAKAHYSGVYNVPRHGYMSKLHSGESVLTASQSAALRSAGVLTSRNGNMASVDPYAASGGMAVAGGATINVNMGGVTIASEVDGDAFIERFITEVERAWKG